MADALPTAALVAALADAGGADAPAAATAQLRRLAIAALDAGRAELTLKRSGYEDPVPVVLAASPPGDAATPDGVPARHGGTLLALVPVPAELRADADVAAEREWSLLASVVGALVDATEVPTEPARPADLLLTAGDVDGHLALVLPGGSDAAFAALAFDERVLAVDRLRARALVVPAAVIGDPSARPPIGAGHPLRVAEAVARLGGDPADPSAADELEDELSPILGGADHASRPHEDPDPARRVARRIAQRLSGMGKWGGFHTEFAHLPRGFAGNDRALAVEVGEALLDAGLLLEKPSVGQRHVYLNSRRAGDIHRLIDDGTIPSGLRLPQR